MENDNNTPTKVQEPKTKPVPPPKPPKPKPAEIFQNLQPEKAASPGNVPNPIAAPQNVEPAQNDLDPKIPASDTKTNDIGKDEKWYTRAYNYVANGVTKEFNHQSKVMEVSDDVSGPRRTAAKTIGTVSAVAVSAKRVLTTPSKMLQNYAVNAERRAAANDASGKGSVFGARLGGGLANIVGTLLNVAVSAPFLVISGASTLAQNIVDPKGATKRNDALKASVFNAFGAKQSFEREVNKLAMEEFKLKDKMGEISEKKGMKREQFKEIREGIRKKMKNKETNNNKTVPGDYINYNKMADDAKKNTENFKKVFKDVLSKLKGDISIADKEALKGKLENFKKNEVAIPEKTQNKLDKVVRGVKDAGENLEKFGKAVGKKLKPVTDKIAGTDAYQKASKVADNAAKGIVSGAKNMPVNVKSAGKATARTMGEAASVVKSGAVDAAKSIEKKYNSIKLQNTENKVDSIKKDASKVAKKIDKIEANVEAIKERNNKLEEDFKNRHHNKSDPAPTTHYNLDDNKKTDSKTEKAFKDFKDGVKELAGSASKPFKAIAEKAKKTFGRE